MLDCMVLTKAQIIIQAYKDHEKALLKRAFFKVSSGDLSDDLVQIGTNYLSKDLEIFIKRGQDWSYESLSLSHPK